MAGKASNVAGILERGSRSKFIATRGHVAKVAPIDTTIDDNIQLAACQPKCFNQLLDAAAGRLTASDILYRKGNSRTILARAVKLSWKDICPRTFGFIPAITAEVNARDGRILRGMPKATAARNTEPMMFARSIETGNPLTSI